MKKIFIFIIINLMSICTINAQCWFTQFKKDFETSSADFKKFIDESEDGMSVYQRLYDGGSTYVLKNAIYLKKFEKLSPDVQKFISQLTDDKAGATLSKFLDDCDSDFVALLNADSRYAEAIVGHKNKFTRADYENFPDEIAELTTSSASKEKLENWINRSSKLSNFGEVVATGNRLSKNITDAIKLKSGKLFEDLAENLGLTTKELELYDVLTEVPLVTTGGFMKADIMLIRKNADEVITDVIIIENKLSATTAFTKRQKEGFGAIINGQTNMTIKYKVDWLIPSQGPLTVSKNKIFKIADAGTDNIANVTIEKIIKVN
ncbi:hypothetical protein IQ05_00720 [Flavobacterium tiangeerense]|uniref:Uncharacterized protein n=1 Tax=Flavobacterium tiangeerense TaxID=459471 RepID=A0ABY3FL19_9FLAO|nr:hypothetical protein [Flavobacterium tiangeerense]TWI01153.1 hypothetical protein IQ05_00720 [Flavobacterium tiangeerense]